MIAFLNGTIKLIENKSFENNEGQTIEFNKIYIQAEDENGLAVAELNSKKDLSEFIGVPATIKLNLRKGEKDWKVSILEVKELPLD